MKAITTRYHSITNRKLARVSASDMDGNRVFIPWLELDTAEESYRVAVRAFLEKYPWPCPAENWHPGTVKGGVAWVYVEREKP